MVFLLGINFPERQLVRKALTSLYGISSTATSSHSKHAPLPPALPRLINRPNGTTIAPSIARHNLLDRLLAKHHIHPTATLGELGDTKVNALTASLSELTIENDLRRKLVENIKRLRDMGSYRGRRHDMGLPVRGQRTRTQIATATKLNKIERKG